MTKTAASPIELTHQLRGIDFPVGKKDLIRHARDNNADEAVLRDLEAMPDQEYRSMRDVTRAMGQSDESDDRSGRGEGRSRGQERERGGEEGGRSRGEERERGEGRERSRGEEREGGQERERSRGEAREGEESPRGGRGGDKR